jgi:uncharacterized integral membrane protein
MGRIIFSVILLVLITVLIVQNLGPTTTVNLFGAAFQNVPIVAVAMLSFMLGVMYSFVLYIGRYYNRLSRERLAKRNRNVEERERKLAAADRGAKEKQESASGRPADEPPPATEEDPTRG